jgi:hypothetical protein
LKSLRRDKPFSFKFIALRCEIQLHCESLFGEIRYRIALLGEKSNPETNFSPQVWIVKHSASDRKVVRVGAGRYQINLLIRYGFPNSLLGKESAVTRM